MPRVHACLDCGQNAGSGKDFCSTRCRDRFNNRAKLRGALLYHLFMPHRFDRTHAQQLGLLKIMNRLASDFREEDRRQREGRRSWRKPELILEERPYLKAGVTYTLNGRAAPR